MELAFYVLGLGCTCLVIFTRSNTAATALLAVVFAYIISARLAPPEVDMAVYYKYLSFFHPYMIKEFLYYAVTSFLYSVLQDQNFVFIVVDIAAVGLLRAFVLPELGKTRAALFVALLVFSFIGVMGLQNVYRQYLASMLMAVGFIALEQKKTKSAIIAATSALFVHNAAVILALMLIMTSSTKLFVQKNIIYFAGGLFLMVLLIAYFTIGIRLKSNRDTGANMLWLYFILAAFAFFLFGHRATTHKGVVLRSASFLILLLPVFQMSGGSTAGERIFMFAFPIFLYEALKHSRHLVFSDKTLEFMIFVVFCGPTLAVYSSRQFLT